VDVVEGESGGETRSIGSSFDGMSGCWRWKDDFDKGVRWMGMRRVGASDWGPRRLVARAFCAREIRQGSELAEQHMWEAVGHEQLAGFASETDVFSRAGVCSEWAMRDSAGEWNLGVGKFELVRTKQGRQTPGWID
jgi:hypothetical protein